MSRRRAADGPLPDGEESAPGGALLPAPAPTSAKARSPAERLLRFARHRPITTLLAAITLAAVVLLALAFAQFLLSLLAPPHSPAATAAHPAAAAAHPAAAAGSGSVSAVRQAAAAAGAAGAPGAAAHAETAAGADAADGDAVTERDAPSANAAKADAGAGAGAAGGASGGCVRTFPAGKLGSKGPLCVTAEYFFDLESGGAALGTVHVGVFGRVVPKSAANFHALATCSGAFADAALCFRGDSFHRVVPGFVVQGGSKATGRSIFGPTFREQVSNEHHSALQHAEPGVLAWAEYPIGSQFYFLLAQEARYLDKNHVVFAAVTHGWPVVQAMATRPLHNERPVTPITIARCGILPR